MIPLNEGDTDIHRALRTANDVIMMVTRLEGKIDTLNQLMQSQTAAMSVATTEWRMERDKLHKRIDEHVRDKLQQHEEIHNRITGLEKRWAWLTGVMMTAGAGLALFEALSKFITVHS